MIYKIIRFFFFLIDPERIHHLIVFFLKFLNNPLTLSLVKNKKLSEITLWNIKFSNRVGLAAGFDKNSDITDAFSVFGFGHIEIGTITPRPQLGNPKPRLFRLQQDKAIINRMGFNNIGVDATIKKLEKRKIKNVVLGCNIGKNTDTSNDKAADDYVYCFEKLYDYADYFVINISCPNISNLVHLQDKDELEKILIKISESRKKLGQKPVLLKISPDLNYSQIDETLDLINKYKIDGIVISNTTTSRDNLKTDKSKITEIGQGGLSGLPLKQRSTELIKYVSEKTKRRLPIIGVGGIFNINDAIEKINAGASLIQIYTGFIYEGPFLARKINKKLKSILKD